MSVSGAWPTEGQVLNDVLSDLPFDPQMLGKLGEQTDHGGFHHLLPAFDFWPVPGEAGEDGFTGHTADQDVEEDTRLLQAPAGSEASSEPVGEVDALSDTPADFQDSRSRNICVELPRSTLVHPKSQYEGFTPPLPPSKERDAVASLMRLVEKRGNKAKQDWIEFELDDFSFYINAERYPFELRPLQYMATRIGHNRFFFDGVLSMDGVRHYVQNVEVSELPVGNYGSSHDTVQGQIWVRSRFNSKKEVYYRLGRPRIEYARFYSPFLWVADLTKHVVDYSAAIIEKRGQVGLSSFKADFIHWLLKTHRKSSEVYRWRRKHPSDDYRTSVLANIDFIWKEMYGVLGPKKARSLQLFREAIYFAQYKPTVLEPLPPVLGKIDPRTGKREEVPPTIVTPYIKDCFGHMVLGEVLKVIGSNKTSLLANPDKPFAASVPVPIHKRTRISRPCFLPLNVIDQIRVGDTISTPPDTDTEWRRMVPKGAIEDDRWFGLVQNVHVAKDKSRSFDVTWFYRPAETPCCMMKYPWPRELFLSDSCTCEGGFSERVKEYEVLNVVDIDWFGTPDGGRGEFFVRQTYITEAHRWITLQKSHMTCSHGRQRLGFRTGDTVLATLSDSQRFSDPYEVVKIFKQGTTMFVRLRRLLRRTQIEPHLDTAPNELVYTDQLVVAKAHRVIGKCVVRFFRPGQPIPTPYDRGGTGNLFYITHRLETRDDSSPISTRCVPFEGDFPSSLRQGFDPVNQNFQKLRGMDLFCGSGNFGRGLEEGGAVDMIWANDIWDRAIHTYMANSPDPESTKPFLGSVDDLLRLALEGNYGENVPRPGEVDFISAGSPCPGFSLLTQDKTNLVQKKNQSLVASFASFVDFYRPKYGILENVSSIVQARHKQSEDVLSQLFCAIVGMGYQAQLILGDAWSHGAPQSRNRVFLYFAAPGLPLPEAPLLSHSHLPTIKNRTLGQMSNGKGFVTRDLDQPTPFKFVSAAEATSDLLPIGDGKAEPAITSFPDHRVCGSLTTNAPTELDKPVGLRHQIACIPTHPHGMSFAKAWHKMGVMSPADRALFPRKGFRVEWRESRGWGRVKPNDVFSTVTTTCAPTDARAGTWLHWSEDRPITVQEVRRAQGFPDREVVLGSLANQWKLVGNSVARQMALALGLKFREAWVGTLCEDMSGKVERGLSESVVETASTGDYGSYRHSTPRDIVDLTSASRSVSPDETVNGVRGTTTPVSVTPKSARVERIRKRQLSQSVQQEEMEETQRSPKVRRLDGPDSIPAPAATTQTAEEWVDGAGGSPIWGPMTEPTRSPEAEEGIPVPAGPTIVRLPTPDDVGN
jgi:DNA (cytosine-5)-methyltransferase 1